MFHSFYIPYPPVRQPHTRINQSTPVQVYTLLFFSPDLFFAHYTLHTISIQQNHFQSTTHSDFWKQLSFPPPLRSLNCIHISVPPQHTTHPISHNISCGAPTHYVYLYLILTLIPYTLHFQLPLPSTTSLPKTPNYTLHHVVPLHTTSLPKTPNYTL